MQGAHHVLHLIYQMRHLVNARPSGHLGALQEAIPLPTALHASDVTTTLWTPIVIMQFVYDSIHK